MIKNIWIEVRPALKCCHFCVILKKGLKSEAKIKIRPSTLVFELNGDNFTVNLKEFTIEPLTMTAFKSTKQCLSFRIQAECDFKFEKTSVIKSIPLEFGLDECSILCQCHNPLTRKIAFERKLPLPANDFSISDMFCHIPISLPESNTAPRLSDCFYSDNFMMINKENITGCMIKGKFLKCKRCLTLVGVHEKNSVKFWISCLKLPFDKSTLFDHFKRLIYRAISNPVIMFPKILLECEENDTYLSLLIVDKNLVVSSCQEDLLLKNMEVVKLKYKFHSHSDLEVKQLKEDPFHSLHHIQVHKTMLDYCTKFLISCSKTIPSIFSKIDNDCMAYLNLQG